MNKFVKSALFLASVTATASLAHAQVTYTCNANIDATVAGTCASFNSVVAGAYNSTFSNANASIYVEYDAAAGLGQSTQYDNSVSYSTYVTALKAESTDPAAALLSNTEPALYGGGNVSLTSALTTMLGLSGATGSLVDPVSGAFLGSCTLGSADCFNVVVSLAPLDKVQTQYGQSYYYPQNGGSPAANAYDIDSIVEHESDEALGTTSCGSVPSNGVVVDGCGGTAPSAEDLFRYNSSGLVLIDEGGLDYFSADGGHTQDSPYYNTTLGGNDYGDFSTNCVDVQDSSGCTGSGGVLSILNDPGTPEIKMLNAVGYNLNTVEVAPTPEPGSIALLGTGIAAIGGLVRRRRNA